jgi:hypothetical protein
LTDDEERALIFEAARALRREGVIGYGDGSYILAGTSALIGGIGYQAYWPDQLRDEQAALSRGYECVRFVRVEVPNDPPPDPPPLPPSI